MDSHNCAVCKQPATLRCTDCHDEHYCSKEHQNQSWLNHKKVCRPFKVEENSCIGRHLVATRLILKGEVILREKNMIWVPPQITAPVCLGCGKLINSELHHPCSKCGWPMCSEKCEKAVAHIPECEYTQKKGNKVSITNFIFPHPNYQCIGALRILYQRDNNKEMWDKLMKLESHCSDRKGTEKYQNDKVSIADFIHRFFKLGDVFTEEEILRVCGIIQINGHEVPFTEPNNIAIYENAAMFEHSCRANCSKSFTSQGEILITSAVPIEKGEHLSICYTDSLWGISNRRHHLFETKYFSCNCDRCKDPTEFGTNFSSLKCQTKECKGFVLPRTFLVNPSSYSDEVWRCNICDYHLTSKAAQNILDRIGCDLEAMQKGKADNCRMFLDYYGKLLHENHYYMTDVKLALSQLIGQENEEGLKGVSDSDLELKLVFCKQLIELVQKLVPAEMRVRGVCLFELHAAIAESGRRKAVHGNVDQDELVMLLMNSKSVLEEALDVLKFEPEELPEGKIANQARRNLMEMEHLLRVMHGQVDNAPVELDI